MKTIAVVAGIAIALCIGCGTSQSVRKAVAPGTGGARVTYQVDGIADPRNLVPEHMRAGILSYLKKELQTLSLLPAEGEKATRLAKLTVESYRMRSGFNRMMFGLFAGKDGIGIDVSIVDAATGEVLGESVVSSYNLAAVGGEEDIARMEGESIAKFLAGKGE